MESNPLARLACATPEALAQAVFAQKERRRRSLASLAVEEKFQHFLQLQRMVAGARRAAGRPGPEPWPVDPASTWSPPR